MTLRDARPRVFVSYARSDGDRLAADLRGRLEAAEVPLWRDREGMEGGRDWWQQITAAIDSVDFLVLLATPAALRSPMVRREWRYARQRGVAVYPVLGDDPVDIDALPRWMRSVHFYDLQHEWRKFVNDLHVRPTPVRVPFMVEDLPADFVARPREYAGLIDHLLDPAQEEPMAVTVALRGAGGYGKTALARALCHDEAIQNAFDDGVLWVTLGERPGDLTALVEDLIGMLSGQRPGFAGLETAVAALAELLADREMLIVIDDVWDAAHLRPFLQGGDRCARLITTRMTDVLPPGARRVEVDAMAVAEAVALLQQGLGLAESGAASATSTAALATLARRLGEWPLLLKLVNGALRERVLHRSQALADALAYVNKALDKHGLTTFDARNADARHAAVATTLGVSLAQLNADELARLEELAVFPEDVDIPLDTLAAYWARLVGSADFDEVDTEMLCERLARLSLLLAFEPTQRYIRLHDVVRGFLAGRIAPRLAALHQLLLGAGRPASGAWADLPAADPYWWQGLFAHLLAAGRLDEMQATALDLRYLAAKAVARTAFSVEADLRCACQAFPQGPALALLRRAFAQAAHLLGDCGDVGSASATLYSRLQAVPGLSDMAQRAAAGLAAAHLAAVHDLPDMPHPALVRTLGSYRGAMRACAISADGSLLATAASDRHITLWDTASGSALRSLTIQDSRAFSGHWVRAIQFSDDGRLLVAAAGDRRLWLWDIASGELRGELRGHTDVVTDCALSRDGRVLVSGSLDGSLRVWDIAPGGQGQARAVLAREWATDAQGWLVPVNQQGHWSGVLGCAISADGRLAASASADQTLILWDLASGSALRQLAGHQQTVTACAFSPDGRRLVSASSDGTLRLWDLASGEHRALAAHYQAVNACSYSADGEHIVSASSDGTLRVWSPDGDELLQTLSGHTDWVNDCAVSARAGLVISAANDGSAKLWALDAPPEPYRIRQHRGWVLCCAALPQQSLLFTGGQDHSLMLWDARRGQPRRHWMGQDGAGHAASVRGCAVSPDGRLLASAAADGSLVLWDTTTSERVLSLAGHRDWVNACAFHPGGQLLASVSNDRTLRLWDLRTRSRKLALLAHDQWINHCAFSPDGRWLVTAAADGSLLRWSLDFDETLWEAWLVNRRPLAAARAAEALHALALAGHGASVNHCAFSPDGAWLVSASSDRSLRVWEAHSGQLLRSLNGHLEEVNGCDVSADGRRIASVSGEGGLKVWSAADGQCLMSIQVDGALSACAWTGADDMVAAVGSRGVYFFACRQRAGAG